MQLIGAGGSGPTLSILLGKGKLAPSGGNTIHRIELCAAVLGVEVSDVIKELLLHTQPNCLELSEKHYP